MYRWKIAVEPTATNTKLLMTDLDGNELLKAALPSTPNHPRALLTLLEGLALWAGQPLTAAIFAGPALPRHPTHSLIWPSQRSDKTSLTLGLSGSLRKRLRPDRVTRVGAVM